MSALAIIDTGVYVDHWEHGRHDELFAMVRRRFIVRQSAVVLSELRRGARTKAATRLVDALHRLATVVWEPSHEDWWRAGKLVRDIGDSQNWEVTKRREFQNDTLIAFTALRYGATVVTTNIKDFRLLTASIKVSVVGSSAS